LVVIATQFPSRLLWLWIIPVKEGCSGIVITPHIFHVLFCLFTVSFSYDNEKEKKRLWIKEKETSKY